MQIERLNNEILIRLSADTDTTGLQRLLDFIKVKEVTASNSASQDDIDQLSDASKRDWWERNKHKFVQ